MGWTRVAGIARYRRRGDVLYVWCEGSNGWRDWWRNIDPRYRQFVGGEKIDAADWREAMLVINALGDVPDGTSYAIMGFSRGAAVAMALSRAIKIQRLNANIWVKLWAPKRCGNHHFMKRIQDSILSTTSFRYDIVPCLPPWWEPADRWAYVDDDWIQTRLWPWTAHKRAAKEAAEERHDIDRDVQ